MKYNITKAAINNVYPGLMFIRWPGLLLTISIDTVGYGQEGTDLVVWKMTATRGSSALIPLGITRSDVERMTYDDVLFYLITNHRETLASNDIEYKLEIEAMELPFDFSL
jgi:hypothetical protein